MVIDKDGHGHPIAWCVCNKEDERTYHIILKTIQRDSSLFFSL